MNMMELLTMPGMDQSRRIEEAYRQSQKQVQLSIRSLALGAALASSRIKKEQVRDSS